MVQRSLTQHYVQWKPASIEAASPLSEPPEYAGDMSTYDGDGY
jgi:hypothetical protein